MHLLQYGLMDQLTPLDLSSSNRLSTSAELPCRYRGPSEKGRVLPLAVAGRTGRQPEQKLPAELQTPADESQVPCCGNTNTRYQAEQAAKDNLPLCWFWLG